MQQPLFDFLQYYVDGEDADQPTDNRPKTITHMHPEPVSEVFLTDGTILRQTYIGTTPQQSQLPKPSKPSTHVEKQVPSLNPAPNTTTNTEEHPHMNCNSPAFLEIKRLVDGEVDPAESASKLVLESSHNEAVAAGLLAETTGESSRDDDMSRKEVENNHSDSEQGMNSRQETAVAHNQR